MVMCTTGKSGLAILMSGGAALPGYISLGSGSGVVAVTNTGLVHDLNERKPFDTIDIATARTINWTTAWGSVTMSGLTIREWIVASQASGGSCWNREGFAGVTFDGTNELQVDVTYTVF